MKPTKLCDFNHPSIISKAKELTKNDNNTKEMAKSIFRFVRDDIKFMMIYEENKASDTLAIRCGDCGTKTNIQVALLRAMGIPARYHIAALKKECIKGLVSKFFYIATSKIIPNHPWCECYLSGNWIACDTLLDSKLISNAYRKGIISHVDIPGIDWDGEHDLNTMVKWIVEDKGIRATLDELSERPATIFSRVDLPLPDGPNRTIRLL